MGAHSTSDDPTRYRSAEEVESWRKKDPVARFAAHLRRTGHIDESFEEKVAEEAREEIRRAVAECEVCAPVSPESIVEDVYEELPWHLAEQREWLREPGGR
jgi:TPP-dependent pyruvate/acetoin dehydrogenase alpha subunit